MAVLIPQEERRQKKWAECAKERNCSLGSSHPFRTIAAIQNHCLLSARFHLLLSEIPKRQHGDSQVPAAALWHAARSLPAMSPPQSTSYTLRCTVASLYSVVSADDTSSSSSLSEAPVHILLKYITFSFFFKRAFGCPTRQSVLPTFWYACSLSFSFTLHSLLFKVLLRSWYSVCVWPNTVQLFSVGFIRGRYPYAL